MGPEDLIITHLIKFSLANVSDDLIITHLIKFSLANVSDEIFSVFNGFDIGIKNLYWIQNILISLFNREAHSTR